MFFVAIGLEDVLHNNLFHKAQFEYDNKNPAHRLYLNIIELMLKAQMVSRLMTCLRLKDSICIHEKEQNLKEKLLRKEAV